MNNITLYQCTNDVLRALDDLDDSEEQWAQDTIEAVLGEFHHKATAVAAYALNLDAAITMLDTHIATIISRRDALTRKKKSLHTYLATNMRRCGIEKITAEDGTFQAAFRKNPPRVQIDDESQIPTEYLREKITLTPDKTAIKKAISAGGTVAGARMIQDERLEIQ